MRLLFFWCLFLSAFPSHACPTIHGYFKVPSKNPKNYVVMKYAQTKCDLLEIGYITLKNGRPDDEVFPAISYLNRAKPELCSGSPCYYFENNGASLRLFYSGGKDFDGPIDQYRCFYDSADYSIDVSGNLKIKYNFHTEEADDPCKKHRGYFEIQSKTEKP